MRFCISCRMGVTVPQDCITVPIRTMHRLGEGRICEELTLFDQENHDM